MSFLFNEWVMIPPFWQFAFSFSSYFGRIRRLHGCKSAAGQRDEVMRLLRLMGTDVNEKRVTILILLLSFGLGALVFLLMWPNVLVGFIFGASLTIAGWQLPLLAVRMIYEQRCTKFVDQMVDGLTIMANGIKAGSNPQESMKRVVEIMGNPISQNSRKYFIKCKSVIVSEKCAERFRFTHSSA